MVVAPDGYILTIDGPYFSDASNNDAQMLRNEFEQDMQGMREWFQNGDIFIVDRGYRDAIPLLEAMGIIGCLVFLNEVNVSLLRNKLMNLE